MANERDDFTSTGIGGLNQERDFETGSFGAGNMMDSDTGREQPVTTRAKEAVSTAGHKAAERVQERLADQVTRATGQLESVASSLRTAGAQMPPDNGIGRYMVQAATQVDNLASFLNNREVGELVDEVEDFARRQPAVFIGGAFALGVLGARFLRSSRHNNVGSDYDGGIRRSYYEGSFEDIPGRATSSTSYGRSGEGVRTGYSDSSASTSDRSSSGYLAGSAPSGGLSNTPGGTTGSSSGFGAVSGTGSSSGPGAGSTTSDLASDLPTGSRGLGTSTGGMSGSGMTGSGSVGSGGSTGTSRERRPGASPSSDEDTRTSAFGNDSLSARPGSGTDRESLDSEDQRSPDFL